MKSHRNTMSENPLEMSLPSLEKALTDALSLMTTGGFKVTLLGEGIRTLYVQLDPHDFPRFIGKGKATLTAWREVFLSMGRMIAERVTIEVENPPEFKVRPMSPFKTNPEWDYQKIQPVLETMLEWLYGEVEVSSRSVGALIDVSVRVKGRHANHELISMGLNLTTIFRCIARANGRTVCISISEL